MRREDPCNISCVRFLAAVLALAACSGGCLSSWVGLAGREEPCVLQQPPPSFLSEHSRSTPPASPGPVRSGLFADFADRAGRIAHGIAHQDDTNPILERMAARQVEEVYALSDERIDAEETRRAFMRFARKSASEAVRQQGPYRDVLGAIREMAGGNSLPSLAARPLFEDPQQDHAGGATRLFPGGADQNFFPALNPSDFDPHIGVGVRPSLGVTWMRFYHFSWEPADGEMVHRVEYTVGGVGLGAAYRIVDGASADAGVGMQFPLGRSRVSVSASRALHGADVNQTPGDQQVMAEMAWRF